MWFIIKPPISCGMIISEHNLLERKKYHGKSLRNLNAYIGILHIKHME